MKKRPLRIAPSHYHVGHIVPATVAKEMMFFEDEGLEEYEIVGGGIIPAMAEKVALRKAMREKSIDIVPDAKPLSVFTLRDNGQDIYVIGCWRNRQETCFVGGKGIKTLSDLKGKRIGTRDLGGISHTLLSTNLRKVGVDPEKDVTWITGARFHGQDNPVATLRKGEVDCVSIGDEDPDDLTREGFSIAFDSSVYGGIKRPSRITAGTQSVIEERREDLEAYVRAIIRAYWFIVDHERNGRYLDALVKRLRRSCLDVEESQRKSLESGGGSVLPFDGAPSVEGLGHILKEAQETGQLSASLELRDVVRLDAVRAAFEQLQKREELAGEFARAKQAFAVRDAKAA
jgi:ABC-type nitrate/sulfonate/bicarbonate transport system substrate-binding protein